MLRLRDLWGRINESLWFIPSLTLIFFLALALLLAELQVRMDVDLAEEFPQFFGINPEGARAILGAIASSMITVAGVIFSITVVTLSLAANQYSPRILRNFMRDRANQFSLGVFVGVFAYAVTILRVIRGGETAFIPSIAVLVAILLALLSVGVLIYFIHHIAESIQASHIISSVARETTESIQNQFPRLEERAELAEQQSEADCAGEWAPVAAEHTGYLQSIDTHSLARWAGERQLVLRLRYGLGEFVNRGTPIAYVQPARSLSDTERHEIHQRLTVQRYRTLGRDYTFGIRQLVDIALKALSPGINDTATALTCIDYAGSVLLEFARRQDPENRHKARGKVCLLGRAATFEKLLDQFFDPVRHFAGDNPEVLMRLLQVLALLQSEVAHEQRLQAIRTHARWIGETAARELKPCRLKQEIDSLSRELAHSRPPRLAT
jgi:uncharacterized membrane protein